MAQTPEQFFTELCTEAGYSPEQTAQLLQLAKHEKVATKLGGVLKTAQDDYQSQVGRQKAAEDKLKSYEQQVTDWYAKSNAAYQQAQAERDAMNQQLSQLKQSLGIEINGNTGYQPPTNGDTSKYLTKEDLLAAMNEQNTRFAGVIKDITRVSSRHAAKFGEELDTEALEETLKQHPGLSVAQAYEQMVGPRLREEQEKRHQKEKEEYAAEKLRDYKSQHHLPVDPVPTESAPMYRTVDPKDMPKDIDQDLLNAWHSVSAKAGT
jgi:membrane-associated HD superfamily phosphohydrolase